MSTRAKGKAAHTETEVTYLPKCDLCHTADARYDAKTCFGPWANLCQGCFAQYGAGLGLGKGQRLVLASATKGAQ